MDSGPSAPNDALRNAAHEVNLPALREALQAGADVNDSDRNGWTALLVAARQGFREGVEELLSAGADPSATLAHIEFNALHQVIQHAGEHPVGYSVTVVREGREVTLTDRDEIRAETGSHPDDTYDQCVATARVLIDRGTDVDRRTSDGQTPLSHAASRGTAEITALLVATKRVDLDSADKDGVTPLHYASRHGHAEPVRLLLEAGADPNSVENYGFTPLHEAAENGHLAVARLLVAAGAEPARGLTRPFESYPVNTTPLGLARIREHHSIVDLLER